MSLLAPERDLTRLAPKFGLKLAEVLNEARWAGLDAVVFEARRSHARQASLYAIGRTEPGSIVTNARSAWKSWHFYGLAADVISARYGWDAPSGWWAKLGQLAESAGLVWGGRWANPRDLPHLQWGAPMRTSPRGAPTLWTAGGDAAVWREVGAL